jgi:RND family efflux transporter MFP subunit
MDLGVADGRQQGWRQAGLAALAAALLLLSACGGQPQPAPPTDEPVAVRLLTVGAAAGTVSREASGTVRLRRETPLAFVADGRIVSLGPRPGDEVAAGQPLAALDTVAIDAAVTAAAADRARAAADLGRQQALLRQGWVAQARVEAAAAQAEAAEAELKAARFRQRFARLSAPAAGTILARLAEPGQVVAAGTPVLVLGERASGHVLRVPMGGADLAGLIPGTVADVRFAGDAAPPMAARVIEVAGRADPGTGTFQVEFALPAHPALRSGLLGTVRWQAPASGGALAVPATALFAARADEAFVWRLDPNSGRVTARLVQLGGIGTAGAQVLAGLAPGDRIVAGGVDRLVEGQKVRAVAGGPG